MDEDTKPKRQDCGKGKFTGNAKSLKFSIINLKLKFHVLKMR